MRCKQLASSMCISSLSAPATSRMTRDVPSCWNHSCGFPVLTVWHRITIRGFLSSCTALIVVQQLSKWAIRDHRRSCTQSLDDAWRHSMARNSTTRTLVFQVPCCKLLQPSRSPRHFRNPLLLGGCPPSFAPSCSVDPVVTDFSPLALRFAVVPVSALLLNATAVGFRGDLSLAFSTVPHGHSRDLTVHLLQVILVCILDFFFPAKMGEVPPQKIWAPGGLRHHVFHHQQMPTTSRNLVFAPTSESHPQR